MKHVVYRIFVLPAYAIILVTLPSFAWVIYSLVFGNPAHPLTYCSYVASAYAVTVLTIGIIRLVQAWKQDPQKIKAVKAFTQSKFGKSYLTDPLFRTKISLYVTLCIGVLYACVHLISGLWQKSLWFCGLAGYYLVLCAMRFAILQRADEADLIAKYRRCRLCGILLFLLNAVLVLITVQIVRQSRGYAYAGLLIYVMAAYSFYAVIFAICQTVRYRNDPNPMLSASKCISLTAATVSILSLETAMLSAFGNPQDTLFRTTITAITGAGVCLVVIGMAIYMIHKANVGIRNVITSQEKGISNEPPTSV